LGVFMTSLFCHLVECSCGQGNNKERRDDGGDIG